MERRRDATPPHVPSTTSRAASCKIWTSTQRSRRSRQHGPRESIRLRAPLPRRRLKPRELRKLLRGVLAADLIAFHTFDYVRHFMNSCSRVLGTDITVDMGSITSNDTRREFPIRRAVKADEFPTATFVLTTPVALPVGLADGETATVDAAGDLTVAGTTNEATFTIEALVRDDGFGVITGSTTIAWEDFGVTPPSAPIVVSIDESGIVEFQLIVAKG